MKRILLSIVLMSLACAPALWPSRPSAPRPEPTAAATPSAAPAPRTELSGVPVESRSDVAAPAAPWYRRLAASEAGALAEERLAERDLDLGTFGRVLTQ
jgi:hypothetical protein